jgi:hypothetical protein
MMHHRMPLQYLSSKHMQMTSMGAAKSFLCRNVMEECEAKERGSNSKQSNQVVGSIMQAKEWTKAFERCKPVTTPPEIIPYCRLNHSIWSLSDNKEASRWVLPGSHPVNHLETQRGSNECIKTPTKVSPEYLTHKYQSPCRVHLLRTIIFDMEVKHLEFY